MLSTENTVKTPNEISSLEAALAALDTISEEIIEATDVAEQPQEVADVQEDDLEDLDLGSLDLSELDLGETEEPLSEELDASELSSLDAAIEKQENYQLQAATNVVTVGAEAPVAKVKSKTSRVASKPRIVRDLSAVPAEFFVTIGDASGLNSATSEACKTAMLAAKPTQVKIAEKFENLFTSLAAGRAPYKYTMTAFAALSVTGSMSSADLIAAFRAQGVGDGTARSQAGQLMHLFAVVGVADRLKHTLTLRADSTIAQRLRDLTTVPV